MRLSRTVPTWIVILLLPSTANAQWLSQLNVGGDQGNSSSLSFDGRWAAFMDNAGLAPDDTNNGEDAYVLDRVTGITVLASRTSTGGVSASGSLDPMISSDGNFVAFTSYGSDFVPSDTNGTADVFLRDMGQGTTSLITVSTLGVQANNASFSPCVARLGRFVAYGSFANNLVSGDTNHEPDAFVRDVVLGTTERVNVASDGSQAHGETSKVPLASISDDGRFVSFDTNATNLVPGDGNGQRDIFVRDRLLGTTQRVSVSSLGEEANGASFAHSISSNGRFVVFDSYATNLVPGDTNGFADVFVHDMVTAQTIRASLASDGSEPNLSSQLVYARRCISDDGRFVVFSSVAANIVPGDTNGQEDVFVRDLVLGTTRRVSLTSSGQEGADYSDQGNLSADGRHVTFVSRSREFDQGGADFVQDAFATSPWLTLSAAATSLTAGDLLSLTTWRGLPGDAALLAVSSVQGVPSFLALFLGAFDSLGNFPFAVVVPSDPNLVGLDVGLQTYALTPAHIVSKTQEVVISFH